MEDLLNEEEFLNPVQLIPYKYFGTFCAIAILQLILGLVISTIEGLNDFIIGLLLLLIPVIMPFVMVFMRKKNTLLPLKTIALGIALLLCMYYVPFLVIIALMGSPSDEILACIIVFVIDFMVCAGVIVPIVNARQKRNSKLSKANQ